MDSSSPFHFDQGLLGMMLRGDEDHPVTIVTGDIYKVHLRGLQTHHGRRDTRKGV
jgi:hypothetical protein